MAGKKASTKKKKKAKAGPVTKAPKAPGAPAATEGIGHNTKIPGANEITRCKARVAKLKEQKAEANAKFMSDIKGVYQEYGDRWGMKIASVRTVMDKAEAEEAFNNMLREADSKKRHDMHRLMAGAAEAFPEDSPMGAWCRAQAEVLDELIENEPEAEEPEEEPKPEGTEAVLETAD